MPSRRGFFRRFLSRIFRSSPPPKAPPIESEGFDGFEGFTPFDPVSNPDPELPHGWFIEGLHFNVGTPDRDYRKVDTRTVTDYEIEQADRIIVGYRGKTGVIDYRTIGGADSKKKIASLITHSTLVVSPPSSGTSSH